MRVSQASKNIANFYACWDLMEITTLSNLVALTVEISGLDYHGATANFSEAEFNTLVEEIFNKISNLGKWSRNGRQILKKYDLF